MPKIKHSFEIEILTCKRLEYYDTEVYQVFTTVSTQTRYPNPDDASDWYKQCFYIDAVIVNRSEMNHFIRIWNMSENNSLITNIAAEYLRHLDLKDHLTTKHCKCDIKTLMKVGCNCGGT